MNKYKKITAMKKFALDALRSIKWFFAELMNMYSNNPSFFSKKRVESGIAFFISQWGMVHWLSAKYHIMTTSDFAMWAGIELAAAGYIINQIQREKKESYESTTEQNNENR